MDGGMVVLLVAGLAKLADLPAFQESLQSWTLVPRPIQGIAVLVVPASEVVISTLSLLRLSRKVAPLGAILLLVTVTAAFAVHLLAGSTPACACFGRWAASQRFTEGAAAVLVRNAILIVIIAAGMALRRSGPPMPTTALRSAPRARTAFTLLETVLSVMLVAVLIALLAPSLGRVRSAASDTVSLSRLRSHAATFAMYTADAMDAWPYFTDPSATYSVVRNPDRGAAYEISYFNAHRYWNVALASAYFDGEHVSEVFTSPHDPGFYATRGPYVFTTYFYGCAFIARPAFWNESTRTGPRQWRPTRSHEVTFPSSKALLFSAFPWYSRFSRGADDRLEPTGATPAALVATTDGRAGAFAMSQLGPQYPGADGPFHGAVHFHAFDPTLHTIDGVNGRDVD